MTVSNPFGDVPVDDGTPTTPQERMATPKQEKYLSGLIAERNLEELTDEFQTIARKDKYTFDEARALIDALLTCSKIDRDPPEGIHRLDGVVYKVQIAYQGSGRKYAKALFVGNSPEDTHWDYVGRGKEFKALGTDTLMTLEQAKEFGQLYGVCCVCGAILTDETSIERGIGPVCEGKMV